ncbi:Endonuclease/exonuclease/phosphatase [Peziza echinospora]|nr:Endonuclease/exonuclease/phosphatase [Peziza echinospora]
MLDARDFLSAIGCSRMNLSYSAYRRGRSNLPPVSGLPPPLVITFESQFKSDAVMRAFFLHRNNKGPLSFSAKIDASLLQRGKRAEVQRYVDRVRKDTGADARQRYRDLENIGIYTFDKATMTRPTLHYLLPKALWPNLDSDTPFVLPGPEEAGRSLHLRGAGVPDLDDSAAKVENHPRLSQRGGLAYVHTPYTNIPRTALQIVYWNVAGGWRDKFSLQDTHDLLEHSRWDVIVIAEPWIRRAELPLVQIPGYTLHPSLHPQLGLRSFGGLLLYVRDSSSFEFQLLESFDDLFCDTMVFRVEDTVFVATYLPPDNSHSISYANLHPVDLFEGLVNRYASEDMVIFGDFNATLLFPDVCSRGHRLLLSLGAVDASVLNGTHPSNSSNTFLRGTSVSTLDYFAVSITLSPFSHMNVLDFLSISDHSPISLQTFVPTRSPSSSTPVRNALPHQSFVHSSSHTPSASDIEEQCLLDSLPTDGVSTSPSTDCFF